MKTQFLFTLMALWNFHSAISQQIPRVVPTQISDQNFLDYRDERTTFFSTQPDSVLEGEGSEYARFRRECEYYEPRLTPHGDPSVLLKSMLEWNESQFAVLDSSLLWREMGPFNSPSNYRGTGPVNFISWSADSSVMFTGGWSCGLWYSVDTGNTWLNGGTDRMRRATVSDCKTSSIFSDMWFIATGFGDGLFSNGYRQSYGHL